ncbi:alpha/beta hydrolase [Actinomadura barringtoniae]|uniref:Alpha/beta hydrolase n=1 Tax=Actinomadura barringtoniae TaxID=1427535 RepID=A0A939T8H6_9ACTN|nr:alpha/beta hydrolase [Actinomadura barringtoniae]MBO2454148.1 alpha/beta hydrolase [Actinomadura barringtoniae]
MEIDGVITTGEDVADETREFNRSLAELLASIPAPYEVDDPPATRAARARGDGPFPAPVRLPEGNDSAVPGRSGDIPVRIFRPSQARGVYLHIHGGGWTLGAVDGQDPMLWQLAQSAGVAVVSVDYRLAPEHPYPAGPDDCEDVARWLIAEAQAEFGTDRLVIGGESAGGHLSATTLLRLGEDARHFSAAQLTFGVFDLGLSPSQRYADELLVIPTATMLWFYKQFLPDRDREECRDPAYSPLYADLRGMPPARFVVGSADPLLDDSLFMAARWRAAGNAAELEIVAEAVHGFTAYPLTISKRELDKQAEFIGRAVGR